jgi:8-oxo-dGTP pyrophosphatase MutT (NUDIX family)
MNAPPDRPGTPIHVAYVDVLVLRGAAEDLEVLCLRRGAKGRSPGSWEAVHGHIDPGETPVETALREIAEETGLEPVRLYNLSRVEAFYRHSVHEIVLIPAFAAFAGPGVPVSLSQEHDAHDWLRPEAAKARLAWPRLRREITDAVRLLGKGDAGLLEDVLRVR